MMVAAFFWESSCFSCMGHRATAKTHLEQAARAWGCTGRRIDRIHTSELLCKVAHIKFVLQLWFERALHFPLCQVSPVQSLLG